MLVFYLFILDVCSVKVYKIFKVIKVVYKSFHTHMLRRSVKYHAILILMNFKYRYFTDKKILESVQKQEVSTCSYLKKIL